MKRILVFWVATVWIATVGAQPVSKPLTEGLLRTAKERLEKRLAGSDIRSRADRFLIQKDSLSGRYTFSSDANRLLPPAVMDRVNDELNQLLGEQTDEALVGQVYFDAHMDSVVVHAWPAYEDGAFMVSASWIPKPEGGIESYSKRLHDYLRNELAEGHISPDVFTDIPCVKVLVTNFGYTVKGLEGEDLRGILDDFWASDMTSKTWTMGIWSGHIPDVRVDVSIFPEYLSGDAPWPENAHWAETHLIAKQTNGNEDGSLIYCTDAYASAFDRYTLVSMVYDPMLQVYRMPCVHAGSVAECNQLVADVKRTVKGVPRTQKALQRIYFYRE